MHTQIYGLLGTEIRSVLLRSIHTARCLCGTHYDILKLPRNCSTQDIRSAFIQLSKQYHPDKNKRDDNTHTLFVQLNEAYTVLSRPDRRREYDLSLVPKQHMYNVYDQNPGMVFKDRSFWENRDHSKMNYDKPYYGIKGIKKMSNGWIVVFCFIFTTLGVGLQVLLINQSVSFSRKSLDEQSQRNAQVYTMIREKAFHEGDEKIFERIEMNTQYYENRHRKLAKEEN